jgi:uncharacterized protein YegP (UPF0339 family)
MRVRLFKKTKDNLSYFQFLSDDEVVLNSQGYQDKEDRNNGVRSVVANAGIADRYERLSSEGKFYFILKAGNGQEIARSEEYDNEATMETAIATCIAEIPNIPPGEDKPAEPDGTTQTTNKTTAKEANPYLGNADGDDNYKPLVFYQEHIKGVENGFDSFASSDGANFYFTLNRGGRIVLISESYTSQSGRNNGADSVAKNLPIADRYQRKVHPNGKHYFNLLAGNNQEIATSVWFDSLGEMNATIDALQRGLFGGESTGEVEAMEVGYRASVEIVEAPPAPREAEDKPKKKRKKREKKEPSGEKVYLKSGGYLFNDVTYQTMQSTNEKYYFSFRDADGKSILINANVRGFDTEEEVDAAVRRILEYGPTEANYLGKTTKNGKYYFYLRDADGNNIGKSFFFDTAEDMQAAIGLLVGQTREATAAPAGLATADAVRDDYLPCDRYMGGDGFHRFFNAVGEEWYFAFNDGSGKTYLRSEGYTTESARDNGIASVIKNAPLEERWKMIEEDGQFFFALRAGNNQEIARSCPYDNAASRDASWAWVTGEESTIGFGSEDREGIRFSAGMIRREVEEADRQRREAAAAEVAKRKEDDYLACKEYEAHVGETSEANPDFATFQHDGEYYFAWVEGGEVLMRSEGYTTESARDNGIASVKQNRELEERFSIDEKMNYFFVVLKAGNHQEIARSCPFKDRAAAMALFPSEREKARAAKLAAAAPPKPERKEDDYLACKVYEAHLGDVSEKYPDFITFEEGGEYYFAWVEDGEIVLRSEGYTTESARNNGIESVMKNRELEERFSIDEKMGYYFLVLKAGNRQEIGRGCPQKDKERVMGWFPMGRASKLAAAAALLVPTVTPEEKEDDYLPCSAYEGHQVTDAANNLALFQLDGQYYFAIYNDDGSVRLRSEGFETTANRNDELAAAIKYLDNKEMYTTMEWGKYRLQILKDENGREVGRSCLERVPLAAIPPILPEKEDDYLKCEEYEGRKVNDKENNVTLFKHENGQFYFAVYNDDGKVRIRSEGFRDAKERDVELSGVLKNIDNEDMYEEIRKGKYRIRVLKDKTGREVGRSCLEKIAAAAAIPLAGAAAAAATAVVATAATPPPPKPKPTPTPPPPAAAPVSEKAGGFPWGWLLAGLLGLALALWLLNQNGCFGGAVPPPPKMEETAVTPPPTPEAEPEPVPAEPEPESVPATPPPAVCNCGEFSNGMFSGISTAKAKSLKRLGTMPEFGNSHSLDAAGFYNKLKDRYAISKTDQLFLDRLFKQMGYANGFADATADLFSSVTLDRGTTGYMGYGKGHQTTYASLDVVKDDDTKAFRIEAANGCTMHFMKTCGNHFFFCPK